MKWKRTQVECKICQRHISLSNILNHERSCLKKSLNPKRKYRGHLKGESHPKFGKKGGNQFTTSTKNGTVWVVKESTKRKLSAAQTGKELSDETKNKISKSMIRAIENGTYKSPLLNGVLTTKHISWLNKEELLAGSYEIKFAKFLDDKKIIWRKYEDYFIYEFQGVQRRYFPDFYLEDYNLFVEVKGVTTDKDLSKWKQFPEKLLILDKSGIDNLEVWFRENL